MSEEWKDIEEYKGLYQVSNMGRVKSTQYYHGTYERILKPVKDGNGYLQARLYKNGKGKWYLVHRLVGKSFIPNDDPERKTQINHIREFEKTNNHVENLEWVTPKENINWGTRNTRISKSMTNGKLSKTVYQYTLDGKFIAEYPSTMEVQRQTGFNNTYIGKCCLGKRKTAYGYIWRYAD